MPSIVSYLGLLCYADVEKEEHVVGTGEQIILRKNSPYSEEL